jgi:hypothetical protein
VKIKSINIRQVRISLQLRFEQSNNSTAASDSAIVELTTEGGFPTSVSVFG